MSQSFYLHSGQETTGPYPLADLHGRRLAGSLPADAQIHDGQSWRPAAEFLAHHPLPAAAAAPPAPGTVPASAAADPERVLQEALRLEKQVAPPLTGPRWEATLFLLSFPVLVPSLLLMFVMAKRWGHIDIYLIIVDGVILMWLGFLTSPLLGVVLLVSWLASIWLYWMRRDRQEFGIFLGYSYLVSLLVVAGGALTIGGLAATLPWRALGRWRTVHERPLETTLARVADRAVPPERWLSLPESTLDFEHTVYRQKAGGTWRFVEQRTIEGLTIRPANPRDLWNNHQAAGGRTVELVDLPLAGFGVRRDRVEIMDSAAKRWLETPGRHFALVANTDARLWVALPAPPAAGTATVSARGVAWPFYHEAAVARAYADARRGNLPLMGVVVVAGESGPPPPAPEVQEAWVPVRNARGSFWVRFPAGVTPRGDERAAGFVRGGLHEYPGLETISAGLFQRDAGRVLYQISRDAYLAEEGLAGQLVAGIAWRHAGWLAAGLLLLAGAVWRARAE